jgi:hypothetical protein
MSVSAVVLVIVVVLVLDVCAATDVESILQTGITGVFVPKGRQDSARGFNPGNAQKTTRPEGAADSFDQRLVWLVSYIPEAPVLPPLWGGAFFYRHLGLKPQAES